MKTPEEKAAERETRELARLTSGIAGRSSDDLRQPETPIPKQLDWFKPHPANRVFDAAKTETYWRDLKRDIREAGRIIDPVIALPDGTLIEGHSRIQVARELATEDINVGKIPTLVLDMSPDEAERRVYLGNLSRFELDNDTRLALYIKVWPDYFGQQGKAGRPGKSYHGDPITAKEIAKQVGKSEPQIKRDRAVVVTAKRIAASKGVPNPTVEDIRAARETVSIKRKKTSRDRGITVKLSLADLRFIIEALKATTRNQNREIIIKKLTRAAKNVTGFKRRT